MLATKAPIRYVLTDIEGTTTSIQFVHEVLFPYAAAHLPAYLAAQAEVPRVRRCLEDTWDTLATEQGITDRTLSTATAALLQWIHEDRKHPALKTLQGYLWAAGYQTGAFQGHVYPDVRPQLERWQAAGIQLGVYSSGSVEAQRLLFGYSTAGDLTPLFGHYFDTAMGPKRAIESYRRIATQLALASEAGLFLSDVGAELDAAAAAGWHTCQVLRPGIAAVANHPTAADFAAIQW